MRRSWMEYEDPYVAEFGIEIGPKGNGGWWRFLFTCGHGLTLYFTPSSPPFIYLVLLWLRGSTQKSSAARTNVPTRSFRFADSAEDFFSPTTSSPRWSTTSQSGRRRRNHVHRGYGETAINSFISLDVPPLSMIRSDREINGIFMHA